MSGSDADADFRVDFGDIIAMQKIITDNSFMGQHLPFQGEENSDQSLNTCSEKMTELIIHHPDPIAVCAFPFSLS